MFIGIETGISIHSIFNRLQVFSVIDLHSTFDVFNRMDVMVFAAFSAGELGNIINKSIFRLGLLLRIVLNWDPVEYNLQRIERRKNN